MICTFLNISLQNSKFTYLSNIYFANSLYCSVCRIQNLHISQTYMLLTVCTVLFVEFKIYISLKRGITHKYGVSRLQNSKFTYLSNSRSVISSLLPFVEFKIYISLKPQIEIQSRNFEFGYKKMDRHRSRPEGNLDKIFI